ncbi:MAG TPA: ABC transporter ATP-binding protein [Crinalium sp.]|jgi:ABC-2 type transport system ATP-binding protein
MTTPVIATTGLTKQFDGHIAVNEVNLQIQEGEIYGLIGPNGAGKTTLIRMLAIAEEPTAGDVYICGQRLRPDQANPEIQRRIGFLPDDFPLYDDLTVEDYLDYFARLYYLADPHLSQRIDEVLDLVSLQTKRQSLIGTLSRGMKQRLSLARTVIHQPQLLLLDEPVSGLDPIARVQYRETIKTLQRQGMTIFISSHVLSDLEDFCTSIGIMELGRLVESAPLQELYTRDRTHRQILIAALGEMTALQQALQDAPLVTQCELLPKSNRICITLKGTDEDAAHLLRSLIEAGFAITEFSPIQDSLEDIFLKLGYRQTS